MTARFLHSFPTRNALRLVKQNQKFAIVTCILQVLGIPLIMGSIMMELYSSFAKNVYISAWAYLLIGCFCLGVAVLLGIFSGINAYHEEWDKSRVDMLYALPLTGKQRFFSNYLGGLGMYLIPYLVAVLLGWIVTLAFSPLVSSVAPQDEINVLPQIYQYYFLFTTGLLVLMWMYYTISALIASCCGTLFENIYTNLLLNLLIPGTAAILLAVITNEVKAIDFSYSWDFIGYMSPIGGLIYMIYLVTTKAQGLDFDYYYTGSIYQAQGGTPGDMGLIPAYLRWIVIIIVLTALLLLLAWRLYEHRKAEQVGKPFVFMGVYYIILTAVTICILCIWETSEDALIPVLIFSMIVYFLMEVIRRRGFKQFWRSAVSYVITVVVTLTGLYTTSTTNAFGRAYYIPAAVTVTSVKLEIEEDRNSNIAYTLYFSDKETISQIQDFHQSCIDTIRNETGRQVLEGMKGYYSMDYNNYSYSDDNAIREYELDERDVYSSYEYYNGNKSDALVESGEQFYQYYTTCNITYYTITGSTIYRSYDVSVDAFLHLMDICTGTEAYIQACADMLENRLVRTYQRTEYADDGSYTKNYYPPSTRRFSVDSPGAGRYQYSSEENMAQYLTVSDLEQNIQVLKEAYRADIEKMTGEQYRTDEIIAYVLGMPVYACNTQTRTLLESWGLQAFTLQQKYWDFYSGNTYYGTAFAVRIYAPGDYRTRAIDYPYSTLSNVYYKPDSYNPETDTENTGGKDSTPCYEDMIPGFDIMNLDEGLEKFFPEMYELLHVARKYYSTDQPCYLLCINDTSYMIPPEYTELAESVIAKGNYHILPASFYFMEGADDIFDEETYQGLEKYYQDSEIPFTYSPTPAPGPSAGGGNFITR